MEVPENFDAYVSHLRAERRRLHDVIHQVESNWPQPSDTIELLRRLREELVEHFHAEEGGGCLERAVCHCPSLGDEADRIERERPPLLAELDEIIAELQAETQAESSPPALRRRFDKFAKTLHTHEAAENRLLENAFGVEVE